MNVEPNAITLFAGEHRFLSNFWPAWILYDGLDYPTVEHAYQAAKTDSRMHREMIRDASTPGQAKRMGKAVPMRRDFYTGGVAPLVMEALVTQKFIRHKDLREPLLRTGNRQLVEGNGWGDRRWGATLVGEVWTGENLLGAILMRVRGGLRDGTFKGLE